jgi:hypothetical protein
MIKLQKGFKHINVSTLYSTDTVTSSQYSWKNFGIDWNNFIRCMTLKTKMHCKTT